MLFKKILLVIFILFAAFAKAQVPPPPPVDTAKRFENTIFNNVEVEASYPGGDGAWRNFLQKNLNANIPVDNDAPAGKYTVVIQFVVSRNGSLSNIKAETNLGYGMEQEVIRIIQKSGVWTAALQNKRTVNAYRRQPVSFLIEDDDYEIITKVAYTLYAATDNRVFIDVKKVKPEDIKATISQGTITTSGDGNFVIRIAEPGRVIITLYNQKKNKKIGSSSFEVLKKN